MPQDNEDVEAQILDRAGLAERFAQRVRLVAVVAAHPGDLGVELGVADADLFQLREFAEDQHPAQRGTGGLLGLGLVGVEFALELLGVGLAADGLARDLLKLFLDLGVEQPGGLRASATKGRSPMHFQSAQIWGVPICVLRNLMLTSNASIHKIGRAHV